MVPLTAAVKVMLWLASSDALAGDRVTLTVGAGRVGAGFTSSGTEALLVGSAWLVAVTRMFCAALTLLGAE